MLAVRYSHQMDTLADDLVMRCLNQSADPLETQSIVVQSNGLAQWLRMRIADQHQICVNVNFPFVSSYLWRLIRRTPDVEIPPITPFDKPVLVWRLMAVFEREDFLKRYPELQRYLLDQNRVAIFAFAQQMADIYDQYQLFRPEWMGERVDTMHQTWPKRLDWQFRLWQELSAMDADASKDKHSDTTPKTPQRLPRTEYLLQLKDHLATLRSEGLLPSQLSIFGVNTMPPLMLDLYAQLAEYVPVNFYLFNPSEMYWGDQQSASELRHTARQLDIDELNALLDTQNPLLASMGRLGRDFIDQLLVLEGEGRARIEEINQDETELNGSKGAPTRLERIRQSIIEAAPMMSLSDINEQSDNTADKSLVIASHYRPMREIEGLHNQILAWLEDTSIKPSDILILTADIERYGALVKQYFQYASPWIPFSVADRGMQSAYSTRRLLFALFDLIIGRGSLVEVLDIFSHPLVAARYWPDFHQSDESGVLMQQRLEDYRTLLTNIGVRWGLNEAHRALFIDATSQSSTNTWQAALSAAMQWSLAGNTLLGEDGIGYRYERDYDQDTEWLLSSFWPFYQIIDQFGRFALHDRPLSEWIDKLQECMGALLSTHSTYQAAHTELSQVWEQCHQALAMLDAQSAHIKVSAHVVKRYLESLWPEHEGQAGFLSGGVTIASMVPMRNIPRKVIGFLGLNEGVFPRQHVQSDLDASAVSYRPGDRHRRLDDRYLFLESILSAQEKLYISYIGRDTSKNQALPPSSLVNELVDMIANADGVAPESMITQHPLHSFSQANFLPPIRNYQQAQYDMACVSVDAPKHYRSDPIWLRSDAGLEQDDKRVATHEQQDALVSKSVLYMQDLIRFWHHPARVWLKSALGARGPREQQHLPEHETIELTALQRYQVREEQRYLLVQGAPDGALHTVLQEMDLMPLDDKQQNSIQDYQALQACLEAHPTPQYEDVRLELGLYILKGTVPVYNGQLSQIIVGKDSNAAPKVLFEFWLQHLCWSADQIQRGRTPEPSTLHHLSVSKGEPSLKKYIFEPSTHDRDALSDLLLGFERGQERLLHWLPDIAGEMNLEASDDQGVVTKKAIKKWDQKWLYDDVLQRLYPDQLMSPQHDWTANAKRYYAPLLRSLKGAQDGK